MNADPFPHLVIDDWLPATVTREMLRTAKSIPDDQWEQRGYRKQCYNGYLAPRAHPSKVRRLEQVTGIDGLLADPGLFGGGFHRTPRGGKLGIHVDFNTRGILSRALNTILFLSDDWQPEWGGQLELWDADKCCKTIEIKHGRMVLFEYTEGSWHGHPEPLQCPEGVYRYSFAEYFYRRGPELVPHGTIYR